MTIVSRTNSASFEFAERLKNSNSFLETDENLEQKSVNTYLNENCPGGLYLAGSKFTGYSRDVLSLTTSLIFFLHITTSHHSEKRCTAMDRLLGFGSRLAIPAAIALVGVQRYLWFPDRI